MVFSCVAQIRDIHCMIMIIFLIGRFDARSLVFGAIGWVWIDEWVLILNVRGYRFFGDSRLLVVRNIECFMAQLHENVIDKIVHFLHNLAWNYKLRMNLLNHLYEVMLVGCTPTIHFFHLVDTIIFWKHFYFFMKPILKVEF